MDRKTVILIVLGIFLAYVLLVTIPAQRVNIKEQNTYTEYLQSQQDSLKKEITRLAFELDRKAKHCEELEQRLEVMQLRYNKLEDRYNEKISSIKYYGHADLERFFTDRYNKGGSSGGNSTKGSN